MRLIASKDLTPADIPTSDAPWEVLSDFIYSIEGYEVAGGMEQLREWTEGNVPPTSLDMARAMLYGHGRWMRWSECDWDTWHKKREFLGLLDYVRTQVARQHAEGE